MSLPAQMGRVGAQRPVASSRSAQRPVVARMSRFSDGKARDSGVVKATGDRDWLSFSIGMPRRDMPALVKVPDRMSSLLDGNRKWAKARVEEDPMYFERLCNQQTPEYLWIGCADSRVPANVIVGLPPGEVFVQRNVGNQALHADFNCMSCLEYSVSVLKVKSVIVCGHYGCGAVKAALNMPASTQDPLIVNYWIRGIRDCRNEHKEELEMLPFDQQFDRLCELNVLRQVFHVCTSPVVQAAWEKGQELTVYGCVYRLKDGLLKTLVGPLDASSNLGSNNEAVFETQALGAAAATESALKQAVVLGSSDE